MVHESFDLPQMEEVLESARADRRRGMRRGMKTDILAFYMCTFKIEETGKGKAGLHRRLEEDAAGIEEQRQLLQSYVAANPDLDGSVCEYIDEKYSGDMFRRPAFNRMIEDVKKGRIQILLMKDVSCLGTEMKIWRNYLDTIFPFLGVRVIVVEANYDSSRRGWKKGMAGISSRASSAGIRSDHAGNIAKGAETGSVPAGNLSGRADEAHLPANTDNGAADALFGQRHSEEIRAGMRRKWESGSSTSSHAPYGFVRDETARGGWAVDPEAAKVVRLIFEKAGAGWQTRMIAEYLNEQQILPPGIYLEQKNLYISKRRKVADTEWLWDTEKVRSVLHRYEYTGAYVHNFREKVSSGNEKTNVVPKSQRIVIEDAHDAIVSQEEYEKAQAAIRTHSKSRYRLNVSHPLRGLIRCGVCGLAMSKIDYANGPLMYCSHKKNAGNRSACPDEYIPLIRIEDSVKRSLLQHGVEIYSDSGILGEKEMMQNVAGSECGNEPARDAAVRGQTDAVAFESVTRGQTDAVAQAPVTGGQGAKWRKAQPLTLEEAAERYVADIFVYSAQNIEIEWKPNVWS